MVYRKVIDILIGYTTSTQKEGITTVLSMVEDIQIVGSASTLGELSAQAYLLHTDLILLFFLPDANNSKEQETMASLCSNNNVLAIATNENQDLLKPFLALGIKGILSKNCTFHELVESIRRVARGKSFMSFNLPINMLFESENRLHTTANYQEDNLTSREKDVLFLLSDGLTNKQIAEKLHLSVRTIEMHLSNLYSKLNVQSRLQAAIKINILPSK